MDSVSIKTIVGGIQNQLDQMVQRANLVPGYLDRVVYAEYQDAQRERWETENTSEYSQGGQWEKLSEKYEKSKKKKYENYPGGGTKLMIATKRLFDSVVGPGADHNKIVTDKSLRIFTTLIYAKRHDEGENMPKRTFSEWSPKFYSDIYQGLFDYVVKGMARSGASSFRGIL